MAEFISFFGGDSKTGTTTIALSCAKALLQKKFKVLVILASLEIENSEINNLGSLFLLSKIEKENIASCISKIGDIPVIYGPENLFLKQFLDPKLIETLKNMLSKDYDFIIADAGSDPSLSLPLGCLAHANRRFYVLTENVKCITRFSKVYKIFIKALWLNEEKDCIIVNKHRNESFLYTIEDISENFNKLAFPIPFCENSEKYEINCLELFEKERAFSDSIRMLASSIEGAKGR